MEPSESEKLLLQLYEDVWNFKMELSTLGATSARHEKGEENIVPCL